MGKSSIRVLIVDDYEPWRRFVSSTLGRLPQLEIIAEVSDGLEAVRKAQQMQPDLIILDIGLRLLNGIEAARQIRKLSPTSTILFVSQESSADVVQVAFDSGAGGYVTKADAGRELLAAVTAVLRGEQFVGSRFAGHHFIGVENLRTSDVISANEIHLASHATALRKSEASYCHEAHFYSNEESWLQATTQFVGTALKAGSAVIVVTTESHGETLFSRLLADGVNMTAAIAQRRYLPFESVELLPRIMVDDVPDPASLFKLVGDVIDTASRGAEGAPNSIVACGELAPLLLKQGKPESAIRLEQLWDQLGKKHGMDILCTYSQASFLSEAESVLQRICAEHSVIHSL